MKKPTLTNIKSFDIKMELKSIAILLDKRPDQSTRENLYNNALNLIRFLCTFDDEDIKYCMEEIRYFINPDLPEKQFIEHLKLL